MSVTFSQAWAVTRHVLRQRLRGVRRYPLVLMLEPLFRCNLACAGCGKIQHPAAILRRQLTPEQCFAPRPKSAEHPSSDTRRRAAGSCTLRLARSWRASYRRSDSFICAPTPCGTRDVPAAIQAVQVSGFLRSLGWSRRGTRSGGLPRRDFRHRGSGHSGRLGCRFSRHDKHDALFRDGPSLMPAVLRPRHGLGCG